jgi:hypothetical protein
MVLEMYSLSYHLLSLLKVIDFVGLSDLFAEFLLRYNAGS